MENGVMEGDSSICQTTKWNMAWEQVLVMVNGFQMLEYMQKIVIPTQYKRRTSIQEQYSKGHTSES
jgi:hypothetical protein